MSSAYSLFSQLNDTKDDWKVTALVTRVWKVFYVRTATIQSIDFILMDEKGEQIHGRVNNVHYDKLKDLLQEGLVLHLKNFKVEEKKIKYLCPVRHKYNILLKPDTQIEKSDETICFPKQRFEFLEFKDLYKRVNNDAYLTDVVGIFNELTEVKPAKNGALIRDLIIDNNSGQAMRITFWENCFANIPEDLNSYSQRVVLVVTSTTAKKFRETINLQATSGTKVYINMEIPEVDLLMDRVMEPPVVLETTRKRSLTEGEKNKIVDVKMALQESTKGSYVCVCVISKVHEEGKWYYNSCEKCKKKVSDTNAWCDRCDLKIDNPIPRFKLNVEIKDESGSVNVTVFDKEATYLLKKSINEMKELENEENGDDLVSKRIQAIVGTEHVFLLKITDYNIEHPMAPLTVATISMENGDPLKRMKGVC